MTYSTLFIQSIRRQSRIRYAKSRCACIHSQIPTAAFSRRYAATNAVPRPPVQLETKADLPLPQIQRPPSQIRFKTAGKPSQEIPDAFNPPESTRPAKLALPERTHCPSALRYYFRLGRAYISFYKTGLQNIWSNHKLAKTIVQRIAAQRAEYQAQARSKPPEPHPKAEIPWTRAEFQLIRRSRHDVSRVPLFLAMFVVCGEFLPLVMALFKSRITPLLPYTVWLPSQMKAHHEKILANRVEVQSKYAKIDFEKKDIVDYLSFGMEYFSLQPKLMPSFALRSMPDFIKLRKTMFYYEYLFWDDKLLGEHGVKSLVDEEVVIAAIERGLWDSDTSMNELRQRLQKSVAKTLKVHA